jgi:uncharacterized protein (DUF58 family)
MGTEGNDTSSMLTTIFLQLVAGALLFIALLNGERALALLFLSLLALMFGARYWSRSSYGGLALSASIDSCRLFPGDRATFRVRAQNNSWLPVWLNIDVSADGLLRLDSSGGDGVLPSRECSLLWYQEASFEWSVTACKRGVYSVGGSRIRTGDLFGFFPKDQKLKESLQVLVYPRLVPLATFVLERMDFQGRPGSIHPVKDPVYLLGTREYQHSRPAKHIHWKASARGIGLQEKLFESTSQERAMLLLDVELYGGGPAGQKFEQTLEVVASLGLRLLEQGRTVTFLTNGKVGAGRAPLLPFLHNRHQARALLELIAQLRTEPAEKLSLTLTRDISSLPNMSCVHFSCRSSEDILEVAGRLRQRNLPVTFVTCHPGPDPIQAKLANTGYRQYRLDDLLVS